MQCPGLETHSNSGSPLALTLKEPDSQREVARHGPCTPIGQVSISLSGLIEEDEGNSRCLDLILSHPFLSSICFEEGSQSLGIQAGGGLRRGRQCALQLTAGPGWRSRGGNRWGKAILVGPVDRSPQNKPWQVLCKPRSLGRGRGPGD